MRSGAPPPRRIAALALRRDLAEAFGEGGPPGHASARLEAPVPLRIVYPCELRV
jgi:hypothetical protein